MSKKTVVIELDFTYTPNEEDVYVYLKELMKDRSLSWEILDQQNSHDDYCNSILALNQWKLFLPKEMDSGDVEMLQEQLRKFSPPQENDDE